MRINISTFFRLRVGCHPVHAPVSLPGGPEDGLRDQDVNPDPAATLSSQVVPSGGA